MRTIGVIGGGAAGMMAALAAAGQGARVTVLEANDRLGKKLLSTGNGKCNLGNEKLDLDEYYTGEPELLRQFLERFTAADTVGFFLKSGLLVKSKNGYLYPASEQASSVLDVLRFEVAAAGIEVVTGCHVEEIEAAAGCRVEKPEAAAGCSVEESEAAAGCGVGQAAQEKQAGRDERGIRVLGGGKSYFFDRVIIATGGKAAPKTGSDGSGYLLAKRLGHSLVPTVPALVQLKCREPFMKSVAGVRAEAELSLMRDGECAARERGELQFTEYGISGIPVFQFSRQINYRLLEEDEVEISIDFLPDYTPEAYERLYISRLLLQGQRTVEEFFAGMLNKKVMGLFVRLAGLKPTEDVETADREKIGQVFALCRQFAVHVTGHNGYASAQVCAGGVPLAEVSRDLESLKAPGVYFAGEILDVDGRCGGYNLQWAWTSGYIAGTAAAGKCHLA